MNKSQILNYILSSKIAQIHSRLGFSFFSDRDKGHILGKNFNKELTNNFNTFTRFNISADHIKIIKKELGIIDGLLAKIKYQTDINLIIYSQKLEQMKSQGNYLINVSSLSKIKKIDVNDSTHMQICKSIKQYQEQLYTRTTSGFSSNELRRGMMFDTIEYVLNNQSSAELSKHTLKTIRGIIKKGRIDDKILRNQVKDYVENSIENSRSEIDNVISKYRKLTIISPLKVEDWISVYEECLSALNIGDKWEVKTGGLKTFVISNTLRIIFTPNQIREDLIGGAFEGVLYHELRHICRTSSHELNLAGSQIAEEGGCSIIEQYLSGKSKISTDKDPFRVLIIALSGLNVSWIDCQKILRLITSTPHSVNLSNILNINLNLFNYETMLDRVRRRSCIFQTLDNNGMVVESKSVTILDLQSLSYSLGIKKMMKLLNRYNCSDPRSKKVLLKLFKSDWNVNVDITNLNHIRYMQENRLFSIKNGQIDYLELDAILEAIKAS